MNASVIRCGGLWVFVVLTATGVAFAAGPDLRLVNAVATQNAQEVRALLDEGIDVNAARADGRHRAPVGGSLGRPRHRRPPAPCRKPTSTPPTITG